MTRSIAPGVALALALSFGAAPPSSGATIQRARYLMGTLCTAVVEAGDTTRAGTGIAGAFDEIARLERSWSSWRSDSELNRLNAAAASWFGCSADLYAALDSSLVFAAATGGAFDPTVEPLNRAWDMRGQGRVPARAEIEEARALGGWRGLALEPGERRARLARSGMGVDLGGIGKGLALDRAAELLRARGVDRALLNFGGEALALGRAWEVSVADPTLRLRPAVHLAISDAAISTSGQSERGVVVKGKRRGHILDPRTGEPARRAGSVTVVAGSATRADALSTALFVMGREAAGAFASAHPDLGVLWLEPAVRSVRAWRWNLPAVEADPSASVEWMN